MTSPQRPRAAATPTAPEGVTAERDGLIARLDFAIMTMSNDDYSMVNSPKRERHVERLTTMLAVSEYLRSLAAQAQRQDEVVRVKPLKWQSYGGVSIRAYTPCCDYTIERGEKHHRLYRNVMVSMGAHDTEAEAKTAAQSDYEARVRSCLLTPEPK